MRALAEELRAEGQVALHVSLGASRQTPSLADVEPRWVQAIGDAADIDLPAADQPPARPSVAPAVGTQLGQLPRRWAMALHPVPTVRMLDEVDTIEGEAMVSFLAQLRSGFPRRPRAFPSSIVPVGLRDLEDCLVQAKGCSPRAVCRPTRAAPSTSRPSP
ncbi:MAG: hypothetical protein D6798_04140 [Deltaproteobacteria bacterium]|nr:MAG: hypothetical protein D6798_04140 [Deltaproteobacteria bacterium]